MEEAVLPMAATALEVGQLETARRLYRRLLVVDPESVEARMGMGDVAMREQEPEAAARWYLSALTRAERPAQRHAALLAHGRGALAAGQLDAALRSFEQLADPAENAPRPSVAWGHNGTGLTLLLQGDLRGGVTAMEQAVLLAPEEDRFRGNLDRALAMLRDFPVSDAPGGDSIGATGAVPADGESARPSLDAENAIRGIEDAAPADRESAPPASFANGSAPSPRARSIVDFAPDGDTGRPPETETVPGETPSIEAAPEPPVDTDSRLPAERVQGEIASIEAAPDPPIDTDSTLSAETVQAAAQPAAEKTDEQASPEEVPTGRQAELPGTAGPPRAKESIEREQAATEVPKARSRLYVVDEDEAYFLQFGAFAELANAEAAVADLRGVTGHPARIADPEAGADIRLHRVRIGPLFSENETLDLVAEFEAAGYDIVNRPQSGYRIAPGLGGGLGEGPEAMTTILVREDGERFLQAGAFAERSAAEDLADELRDMTGHPVRVSVFARADGPPLHRVRVGPLGSDDPLLDQFPRRQ